MKKYLALFLALVMILSLVACQKDRPTKIVLWSNWSGAAGGSLQTIVDGFNDSQEDYVVKLIYAGDNDEIRAKIKAADVGKRPDLFCVSGQYAYYYFDHPELFVPVQGYADSDHFNFSDLMVNLTNAYSDAEGRLLCAPLCNNVFGCWYNKDLLESVGIDSEADLASLEQLAEACDKLQANGIRTPFYVQASTNHYTYALSAEGLQLVDNDNGRERLPTKAVIDSGANREATEKYWQIMMDMSQKGQMPSVNMAWKAAVEKFIDGEIAFLNGTVSAYSDAVIAEKRTLGFELGFIPAYTISKGVENYGQSVGGGCIFIGNNENENRVRGAWEFLKYALSSENVTDFAMASGYLPATVSGWNSDEYQFFVKEKLPVLDGAFNAVQASRETCCSAWIPMFSEWRKEFLVLMEDVISNPGNYTPQVATQKLIDLTNASIREYTLSEE